MKIAHVGIVCFFTEGMTYQDNQLTQQNVADGHEVLYISNAAKYVNGKIVETGYEDIVLPDGMRLVRLPYERIINKFISGKLRKVKGLYKLLCDFAPDVILSHDLCYLSVFDVLRYKKEHPQVKLYADTHTEEKNSGLNWLSMNIQHKIIFRYLYQKAYPYLEKYFYISQEIKDFSVKHYGLPEDKMEFFPLCGHILKDSEYAELRASGREELGLTEDETVFIHAGKLEDEKRTDEILSAFASVPELKAKLIVCGSIPEDMKERLVGPLHADERVLYLGWKKADELIRYLCAADLYLQPGGQSSIMQNAVCCRKAVMLYPHPAYVSGYDGGNVIWVETEEDMRKSFETIASGGIDLKLLGEKSSLFASEYLDYGKLAAKLYE